MISHDSIADETDEECHFFPKADLKTVVIGMIGWQLFAAAWEESQCG
jgi:hypothetical protein